MDEIILSYQETLLYYDGPQLISAKDQIGGEYICLLDEMNEGNDFYFCIPISHRKLGLIRSGEVDLRSAFEKPEIELLYKGKAVDGDLSKIGLHRIDERETSSDWLPEPGIFLNIVKKSQSDLLNETTERNRLIILCNMNPPEASNESKISVENLIEGVGLYQRVLKYAYSKSIQYTQKLSTGVKNVLNSPENYRLEVFGFSGGSFTVLLQTEKQVDLLGYAELAKALELIDSISAMADDSQEAFSIISKYGGHFATAYKDLLQFIVEKQVPLNYEWTMPQLKTSITGKIIPRFAEPLYEKLVSREEVGVERKKLKGRFTLLGKSGQWNLFNEEDNKEYKGTSDIDLAGTIFMTQKYSIECEEKIIVNRSTGREVFRLHLLSYELA